MSQINVWFKLDRGKGVKMPELLFPYKDYAIHYSGTNQFCTGTVL
jgi:hypothetical protein